MRVHDEQLRDHMTCHHTVCFLHVWSIVKIFKYLHIMSEYTSAFEILHKSEVIDHNFLYIRVQCLNN